MLERDRCMVRGEFSLLREPGAGKRIRTLARNGQTSGQGKLGVFPLSGNSSIDGKRGPCITARRRSTRSWPRRGSAHKSRPSALAAAVAWKSSRHLARIRTDRATRRPCDRPASRSNPAGQPRRTGIDGWPCSAAKYRPGTRRLPSGRRGNSRKVHRWT